ncbi:MAG TPA: aspartate-semialdehyde dehydrogenase [Gemmatimonadales bacterium]
MTDTGQLAAAPIERIPVAVLGATGAVGQAFVRLLAGHPWFVLTEVAASERSAGRPYGEAVRWVGGDVPPAVAALPVRLCDPAAVSAPIVFSALDASVALETEQAFARAGRLVVTNARNHRMEEDVPLVIPEVNADHLALLDLQRQRRHWKGGIVANGNCAAIVIAMALAPLHRAFGLQRVFVTTLQAVSGAGYPGVPSLDILGNVIPYIGGGEEEKIELETVKMLGAFDGDLFRVAPFGVSAQVNRVPVEHGHTACIAAGFERTPTAVEAVEALRAWVPATAGLDLPSAPASPIVVLDDDARPPQPRRDADRGRGMTVTVGRVRPDTLLDLRMAACGHNIIRGAAGAALLNAELLVARGLVTGEGVVGA